jgi:hypothetical protein
MFSYPPGLHNPYSFALVVQTCTHMRTVAMGGGGGGNPIIKMIMLRMQEGPLPTFKLSSCIIMENFTDVYYKRNVLPPPFRPNLFSFVFIFFSVSDVEKGLVYIGQG